MRLMVTTMRDEAPFLLEWLAYHRAIGFTDFLVYSNDCADGTDRMLDRLAEIGWLAHVPNPRTGKKTVHFRALSRARHHPLTKRARWIMVADCDEFLVIHPGAGRLDDLIAAVPDAAGFAVPWRMFGSAGRHVFEDAPVTAQFTRAAPERMLWPLRASQFKSFYRADPAYARLGIHRPLLAEENRPPPGFVDGCGQPYRFPSGTTIITPGPKYALAQINHYALGSAESFLVKAARGRANHTAGAIDLGYWVERNFNVVEDRSILRHEAAIREGMAELLADPVLGPLHAEGVAWRRARIAELLRDHEVFRLFSHIVQSPATPELPWPVQLALCTLRRNAPPEGGR